MQLPDAIRENFSVLPALDLLPWFAVEYFDGGTLDD